MVVDVMGDVLCRSVGRFKHMASQDAMGMMVGGPIFCGKDQVLLSLGYYRGCEL